LHRELSSSYDINITTFDPDDPLIVQGKLTVSNEIGQSVAAGGVQVTLLDYDCVQNKSSTGLEVELFNTDYTNTSLPLTYNIELNQELVDTSPGGFVNFTTVDKSTGNVLFCTRVSTYQGDIEVSFRESRFDLSFDLTNNTLSLINIGVDELDLDVFSTDVDDTFAVSACQCDTGFNCLSTPLSITTGDSLLVCLTPTSDNDASIVEITNFNLRMSSDSVTYDPVIFGTVTWAEDILTAISLDSGSNKIMINAPVIAQFFIQDKTAIDVSGNAFLEFAGSLKERQMTISTFGLTVALEKDEEGMPGCLQWLIGLLLK